MQTQTEKVTAVSTISGYLDTHEYPAKLFEIPGLVRLLQWINGIVTLRNWYVRKFLRRTISSLPRNFTLLDAGCGMGDYTFYCAKHFPDSTVVGVDDSNSSIQIANTVARNIGLRNVTFLKEDLMHLVLSRRFDVVLCNSVLHSIQEDELVLRNLSRILGDDGKLVLYVPVRHKRYLPKFERLEERHLTRFFHRYSDEFGYHKYSKEEIKSKMERNGLAVEEQYFSYGVFGGVAFELYSLLLVLMKKLPSSLFAVVAVCYAITVFPVQLILMLLDFITPKREGNGTLIIARRA